MKSSHSALEAALATTSSFASSGSKNVAGRGSVPSMLRACSSGGGGGGASNTFVGLALVHALQR